jgi:hypothetical protein
MPIKASACTIIDYLSLSVGKRDTKGEIPPWRPSVRSGGLLYLVDSIMGTPGVKESFAFAHQPM